jgi:hypothetical protein
MKTVFLLELDWGGHGPGAGPNAVTTVVGQLAVRLLYQSVLVVELRQGQDSGS